MINRSIEDIDPKFLRVLEKYVVRFRNNTNVLAIVVIGSVANGEIDPNSDLDVYIVLEKATMRERGNMWIDGIEIEYFINPIKQITKGYFIDEFRQGNSSTARMLANCRVVYQKNKRFDLLIRQAKRFANKRLPKMTSAEVELAKYMLDDLRKDLEDVFYKNDMFTFNLISGEILQKSLAVFFRCKRHPIEKNKRVKEQLDVLDKKFKRLYFKAMETDSLSKKMRSMSVLIGYVEKLLGGGRPKNWRLVSKCPVQ